MFVKTPRGMGSQGPAVVVPGQATQAVEAGALAVAVEHCGGVPGRQPPLPEPRREVPVTLGPG